MDLEHSKWVTLCLSYYPKVLLWQSAVSAAWMPNASLTQQNGSCQWPWAKTLHEQCRNCRSVDATLCNTPVSIPLCLTSLFQCTHAFFSSSIGVTQDLLAWETLSLLNDSVYLCSGHDVYIWWEYVANFNVPTGHLGVLLKYRFWVGKSGWSSRVCVSHRLPGDAHVTGPDPHFEQHDDEFGGYAEKPLHRSSHLNREGLSMTQETMYLRVL